MMAITLPPVPSASIGSTGDRRRFRLALPSLYPFATETAGAALPSLLDGTQVIVRVPPGEEHGVVPGTGAKWIVPRTLELEVSGSAAQALATSDRPALQWWTQVTDWLGAWVGIAPAVDVSVTRQVLPLEVAGEEASPAVMEFYGMGEFSIGRSDLAEALVLAGAGGELPTEYQLLVHAQTVRRNGDLRVAVLEAVAAAEVACTQAVERKLAEIGAPSDFVAEVRPRASGKRTSWPSPCSSTPSSTNPT